MLLFLLGAAAWAFLGLFSAVSFTHGQPLILTVWGEDSYVLTLTLINGEGQHRAETQALSPTSPRPGASAGTSLGLSLHLS